MLLIALALLPVAKAQEVGGGLAVTGVVINGADGNPLPFCFVHLMQDGRSRAMAVTDYAGNYTLPPICRWHLFCSCAAVWRHVDAL